MVKLNNIQLIGSIVAVGWEDGTESYFTGEQLRKASPSAEKNSRLREIADGSAEITIQGWHFVGNYAVRFSFSDGHRTGIYSYLLLKQLADDGKDMNQC